MTAVQLNTALDREIWKMRNNKVALQKMLEAAQSILLTYGESDASVAFKATRKHTDETEAERQFRSLRGCWTDDPEDAERMENAIRDARLNDVTREINIDD